MVFLVKGKGLYITQSILSSMVSFEISCLMMMMTTMMMNDQMKMAILEVAVK